MAIEKLSLRLGRGVNPLAVYNWITAAVSQDVQHLDLCIFIRNFTTMPSTLFTCRTLVTLKLDRDLILNVPDNVCLPTLKTVHLMLIKFLDDGSLNRLLSSCGSLEDMALNCCNVKKLRKFDVSHPLLNRLTIDNCLQQSDNSNILLVIDVPSLVYFKFIDLLPERCSLLNLQCLSNAEVNYYNDRYTNSPHGPAVTNFFTGIRNVKSLDLSVRALELLLCYGLSHLLSEVVQLKIYEEYPMYHDKRLERALPILLKNMHKLEKLAVYKELCFKRYLPKEVPLCLERNLKEIEILPVEIERNFGKMKNDEPYLKYCIKYAKYFLKNTTYLEKLIIRPRFIYEESKLKMAEELMDAPRKSEQCLILIV